MVSALVCVNARCPFLTLLVLSCHLYNGFLLYFSCVTETPIVREMYSSILHRSHPCVMVSKTQWLEMENVGLMETPRYSRQVSRVDPYDRHGGILCRFQMEISLTKI